MQRLRSFPVIMLLILPLVIVRCSKSSTTPPDTTEPTLVLKIDPTPVSGVNPSLSPSYSFTATITSALPKAGVDLEFETLEEATNLSVDKKQSRLMASSMQLTTISLTPGVVYLVKVTATSVSTASNKSQVSFRLARK